MIETGAWLAFTAASVLVVIVPGPTVTIIVANSLRGGSRAGLLNVAGTQAGLALMILVLAVGLEAVVARASTIFDVLRLIGAGYLIWLGMQTWRGGRLARISAAPSRSGRALFLQGLLVIWSNPKALLFFGAFIPQFVNTGRAAAPQVLLLGSTFMAVATLFDGAYAVVAGRAGSWLSARRVRTVERVSGACLIGGGTWLVIARPS